MQSYILVDIPDHSPSEELQNFLSHRRNHILDLVSDMAINLFRWVPSKGTVSSISLRYQLPVMLRVLKTNVFALFRPTQTFDSFQKELGDGRDSESMAKHLFNVYHLLFKFVVVWEMYRIVESDLKKNYRSCKPGNDLFEHFSRVEGQYAAVYGELYQTVNHISQVEKKEKKKDAFGAACLAMIEQHKDSMRDFETLKSCFNLAEDEATVWDQRLSAQFAQVFHWMDELSHKMLRLFEADSLVPKTPEPVWQEVSLDDARVVERRNTPMPMVEVTWKKPLKERDFIPPPGGAWVRQEEDEVRQALC